MFNVHVGGGKKNSSYAQVPGPTPVSHLWQYINKCLCGGLGNCVRLPPERNSAKKSTQVELKLADSRMVRLSCWLLRLHSTQTRYDVCQTGDSEVSGPTPVSHLALTKGVSAAADVAYNVYMVLCHWPTGYVQKYAHNTNKNQTTATRVCRPRSP